MTALPPIRVLVIEDSSTIRRVVSDALNSDPEITVVGTASNGRIGLLEIAKLAPDLITLDIEMPEMDGLTMLSELRTTNRRIPVIMVSTLTGRGAAATLDALSRGASDYVTKPTSATANSSTSAIEHFRRELVPRVKALCPRRVASVAPIRLARRPDAVTPPVNANNGPRDISLRASRIGRFDLLAIGCSTGGPNALESVLIALPADFPAPIMVTQHMPPMFTKLLAERIDQKGALKVVEAVEGMILTPGTAYIAPGDYHLVVRKDGDAFVLATNQAPQENSCRPAVDVMFRSIAEIFGGRTLAVIMTGMGYDGRVGAAALVAAGAEIIVQDQATSVVWGMPGAVAEAGLASEVLPLQEIAGAIDRRFVRRPMQIPPSSGAGARTSSSPPVSSARPPATRPLHAPAVRSHSTLSPLSPLSPRPGSSIARPREGSR